MDQKIINRIQALRAEISKHNRLYYVLNAPAISDYDFDMLLKELETLEKAYPDAAAADSPTMKVGSDLDDGPKHFVRRPHRYPMLSLGNTYNLAEVEDFSERVSRNVDVPFTFSCELKFDGTAICLTYRHGELVQALTRGDGLFGDDVLSNVRKIECIPQRLKGNDFPDEFEIRGEIYMPHSAFEALCLEKEEAGEEPFANPRNAASGSLKLLDSQEVSRRGLQCTLYHMLGENLNFETHDQALAAAQSWGLPVSGHRLVCNSLEQVEQYINRWDTERHSLPFATDGVVIKINELALQKELGFTSKFPRWAVAYKFKAEQACTQVLSIDYQVGRTGAVTPVANLSAVELSGTTVKRATLHNDGQIQQLDIRIGDWVYVEKGGEIIPKITSVELSRRPLDAVRPSFPTRCPDCGTPLIKPEGEARWFCTNVWGCPSQAKLRLIQFLSRQGMNIMHIGESAVSQMYDLGLVRHSADFYSLEYKDLYRLEGWKEKSCERFLKSLQDSRKTTFDHVLFALGIRYIGQATAKTLAHHFGNIDALIAAGMDELTSVKDIGEINARSVIDYFAEPRNMENLERLRAAGLRFSIGNATTIDNALEGKNIVITGTYSVSRDEMKEIIEKHSGKVSGSISGKTSFVLAGENPGPEKIRKAQELAITLVDEEEFFRMIGMEEMANDKKKELTLF